MIRAACTLLTFLLCACEPASLPAPSILSVKPERLPTGSPSVLSVQVDAVLPVSVDYQGRSVDRSQLAMTLWIAGQAADIAFAEPDGTLVVAVPAGLALGEHELRVRLADGREAVRERAFSIVPAPGSAEEGDGGQGTAGGEEELVRGGLTGFQIDPIGDQVRNVPFQITLRAVGPSASTFEGQVSLRASKGKVSYMNTGRFVRGVRVEEISLDHPNPGVFLLAEDPLGNQGLSNSFRVRPH